MGIVLAFLLVLLSGFVTAICLYEVLPNLIYVIGLMLAVYILFLSVLGFLNELDHVKKRRRHIAKEQ